MIAAFSNFLSEHFSVIGILFVSTVSIVGVLRRNVHQRNAQAILDQAIAANTHEPATLHPQIDPVKCAGCGACTKVCPEGDILQMVEHKAVLVSPSKCIGHGECEQVCPFGAIDLVFGTKTRGLDIPRLASNLETNVPGLYIAGELGGMGLIRNAVKQGHLAAADALKKTGPTSVSQYDILIVGSGPAGLAAALTAIAQKATYLVVEQGTFGGSVANYPRQKLVMSHPADLPIVGKMKFRKNQISKEELMDYWQGIRKQTGLQISEKVKFESLEKRGGIFHVKTSSGEVTARKVVLAMGVRGTPRKLGLPREDLPKVTYNLLDAEQYVGQKIAIVGSGNSALEAVQSLAQAQLKNKVTLIVVGPTFHRANDTNTAKVNALVKSGLVEIHYESSVTEIQPDSLKVKLVDREIQIENNFLFVFIGAEMPTSFLLSLGVVLEKKFGETLRAVNS